MKQTFIRIWSFFFFLFISSLALSNPHRYVINPTQSTIECSVNYLVVPKIQGKFMDFSGVIYFDPKSNMETNSVLIKVKTASIETENVTWNKIIRSNRILDSQKYPLMIFQSSAISSDTGQIQVTGTMDLHGTKKEMTFPFSIVEAEENSKDIVVAKGQWILDRKDFNITWHSFLDKGGVIVGNKVTIDWKIVAKRDL